MSPTTPVRTKTTQGGILAAVAVAMGMALLAAPAGAQDVIPAEQIREALTRNIIYEPEFTPQDYTTPETSHHISLPTIMFALDSARLEPGAIRQLTEVITVLNQLAAANPQYPPQVTIEGHTCDRGTAEYNLGLSQRRARAVADYLVSQGVPPQALQVFGWGLTRPAVPNTSEENRRYNRRVDFILQQHRSVVQQQVGTRGFAQPRREGQAFLTPVFEAVAVGEGGRTYRNEEIRTLRAGDKFRVSFDVLRSSYVYGLYLGVEGSIYWLLQGSDNKAVGGVWCYYGDKKHLPRENHYYTLDEKTGTMVVCLIATSEPITDVRRLSDLVKARRAALTTEDLKQGLALQDVELHKLIINQE